ncbi:MAG TPA: hypothetical protein DDZ51_00655 [Planctomycetaceae bacterium]|nr:hypothetical protein [Planctomycetaceae bacterium]
MSELTDTESQWPPDPTPAEIAERSAEVRARWSDDEHIRRQRITPPSPRGGQDAERMARGRLADRKLANREAKAGSEK